MIFGMTIAFTYLTISVHKTSSLRICLKLRHNSYISLSDDACSKTEGQK
jgi:hypothetical protein